MNYINIDGHRIEEVRQTKFLGVILDNTLNSHAHCEYICGLKVLVISSRREKHLKHVLVLQNKAVRIIAGVPPRTSADNFYLELDILPFKNIFVHAIGIFT